MPAPINISVLGPSGHKNEYHCATLNGNWQEERLAFGKQPDKHTSLNAQTTYTTSYKPHSESQLLEAKPPGCFSDEAPHELLFLHGDGPYQSYLTIQELSYTEKAKPLSKARMASVAATAASSTSAAPGPQQHTVVFSLDEQLDMQGTSNRCAKTKAKRQASGLPPSHLPGSLAYCGETGLWQSAFRNGERGAQNVGGAAESYSNGSSIWGASRAGSINPNTLTAQMISKRTAAQQEAQRQRRLGTQSAAGSHAESVEADASDTSASARIATVIAAQKSGYCATIPAVGQAAERDRFLTTKNVTTDVTGEFLFEHCEEYPAITTRRFGPMVVSCDNPMHKTNLRVEWENDPAPR